MTALLHLVMLQMDKIRIVNEIKLLALVKLQGPPDEI